MKKTGLALLLFIPLLISGCAKEHLRKGEYIKNSELYIYIRVDAVVETAEMDQKELDLYMEAKARKRAAAYIEAFKSRDTGFSYSRIVSLKRMYFEENSEYAEAYYRCKLQ